MAPFAQNRQQTFLVMDVQGRGRFVEHQDRCLLSQCASQRNPGLLPTGQLAEWAIAHLQQIALRQCRFHHCCGLRRPFGPGPGKTAHLHHFVHQEWVVFTVRLRHQGPPSRQLDGGQ